MEFIRGLHNLRPQHRGCAVTIGNFDGVHLGHRAVLRQLQDIAQTRGLASAAIVFEPQPVEFFRGADAPPRLYRLADKISALDGLVERLLCVHFNAAFAELSADAFVSRVLVDGLGARHVVVGDDFRFGRQRSGDFDALLRFGDAAGFTVSRHDTFVADDERISSTRIRSLLAAGDCAGAARLLGQPYTLTARVAHGQRLGRTIGFPTLNLALHHNTPVRGVFAVSVAGLAAEPLPGVANIGMRPTVEAGRVQPMLEVHLFDFDRQVYGQRVSVALHMRIRDEQKFASLDALQAQIKADAQRAREYFKS